MIRSIHSPDQNSARLKADAMSAFFFLTPKWRPRAPNVPCCTQINVERHRQTECRRQGRFSRGSAPPIGRTRRSLAGTTVGRLPTRQTHAWRRRESPTVSANGPSRRPHTSHTVFPVLSTRSSSHVMLLVALAACALLSAVLALALLREVRLRRALEAVLRRLLTTWRRFRSQHDSQLPPRGPDDPDCSGRL